MDASPSSPPSSSPPSSSSSSHRFFSAADAEKQGRSAGDGASCESSATRGRGDALRARGASRGNREDRRASHRDVKAYSAQLSSSSSAPYPRASRSLNAPTRHRVPLVSVPFTTYSASRTRVKLECVLWIAETFATSARTMPAPSSSPPSECPAERPTAGAAAGAERDTDEAAKAREPPRALPSDDGDLETLKGLKVGRFPMAVLVHQYSLMGGSRELVQGKARILASRGVPAVAFDLRGVGGSEGRATFTGGDEVQDTVAVCRWAVEHLSAENIFLIGTSAGAPISGSAVPLVPEVKGWVGIGYTFGFLSSILFSHHYKNILESDRPKLFLHAGADGFTSTSTFKSYFKKAKDPKEQLIIDGVGHFELEGPSYDQVLCGAICAFIEKYSATPPVLLRW
ncbi:esterase/lipase/thioesterase domain-containing protein [Besnoitia besnoiti]|uniref:Esterase/lipase/thioesterase domain-containing protein n=1 Tax=Besnoitia besnoiti TaxID=94643 RepID=A0A2A9MP52_BESBE|nr:esterase/lipase/thioesterase domain-containing protein [Besnoitia besnoiti]PFH38086.1 esterase/lipase/thioesterase domain-containing protein [Besnoitia besnoiti]